LVVRRDTGRSQERHEQHDSDALVNQSTPQNPRRNGDQLSPYNDSFEKLSVMVSLHTLSDLERNFLIRNDQSCVICFDDYTSPSVSVMSLPCGHTFHGTCICQWIIRSARRSCPKCRKMLLNV